MPDEVTYHNPYNLTDLTPTFRAAAALAAAGAFDAAPLEIDTTGMDVLALYVTYTRAGAGGAVDLQPEFSPRSVDAAGVEDWFQATIYNAGAVAAGVDTASLLQREDYTYQATGAGAETFVYALKLNGAVERVRIPCAESGAVGTPGACHIVGRLM